MADYRPVLIRAISGLDGNTPAARQCVYANARTTLEALLFLEDHSRNSEEAFGRERRALEDAICEIESSMTVGTAKPRSPLTATLQKDKKLIVHELACGSGPRTISEFFSWSDEESFDFQPFEHEAERECIDSLSSRHSSPKK
jgi:hypothetical protein